MGDYISSFIVGGIFCVIAQILMDKTKLTPGRILVIYVTVGAILVLLLEELRELLVV